MAEQEEIERVKKVVAKAFKNDIKEISKKHNRSAGEVEDVLTKFILELIEEMKK